MRQVGGSETAEEARPPPPSRASTSRSPSSSRSSPRSRSRIYYIDFFGATVIVPLLLAFAVIKFIMVALWFMHLQFDSRIFRRFFITGIILALIVFGIVLWIFFTHGGPAPTA